MFHSDRLERLAYWINEREAIRKARAAGKPKPWTQDSVLQSTRFCNVRRMDDKVSLYLLDEWYYKTVDQASPEGHVLASAGAARLFNWPDTLDWLLKAIGDNPRKFKWDNSFIIPFLRNYRTVHGKVFTGAYIINAAGANGRDKIEVVCRQVSTLFRHGELLDTGSMERTHQNLMEVPGIGSFIAGQIVADLRHIRVGEWADRMSWAPLGPGSRRGIAWLEGWNGREQLPRLHPEKFREHMLHLVDWAKMAVPAVFKDRRLEAHDLQNCLCEYDKFMRLSYSTGRGKNKYLGA